MSTTRGILLGGIAVVAALAGGYWLGRSGQSHQPPATNAAVPPPAIDPHAGHEVAKERQILFYQNPDGSADYSPTPKKDDKGRDYTPVYADPEPEPAAAKPAGKGKILYYRKPMGLADTSPVPKKDGMGMDYVPVYEGEDDGSTLKVTPAVALSPLSERCIRI